MASNDGYWGRHIACWTCCTGLSSVVWARPSFSAACATAIATAADTVRRLVTGGSRLAPRFVASERAATAAAAAVIMVSVIRAAQATVTASPRPGDTRE